MLEPRPKSVEKTGKSVSIDGKSMEIIEHQAKLIKISQNESKLVKIHEIPYLPRQSKQIRETQTVHRFVGHVSSALDFRHHTGVFSEQDLESVRRPEPLLSSL